MTTLHLGLATPTSPKASPNPAQTHCVFFWKSLLQPTANTKSNSSAIFSNGEPDYYIKQNLQNLNGDYEFSYYYRVVSVSSNADYTCNIQLTVGHLSSYGEMYDNVGGWRSGSVRFSTSDDTIAQAELQFGLSCYGEFTGIEVDIDTLAFTRVCSA